MEERPYQRDGAAVGGGLHRNAAGSRCRKDQVHRSTLLSWSKQTAEHRGLKLRIMHSKCQFAIRLTSNYDPCRCVSSCFENFGMLICWKPELSSLTCHECLEAILLLSLRTAKKPEALTTLPPQGQRKRHYALTRGCALRKVRLHSSRCFQFIFPINH